MADNDDGDGDDKAASFWALVYKNTILEKYSLTHTLTHTYIQHNKL